MKKRCIAAEMNAMNFPSHNLMRMAKRIIIFCALIILINGILNGVALAASRDVIIGYYKPAGVSEIKDVQSYGGKVKKNFHLINAVSATMPEDKIEVIKKDSRIKYVVNDTIYKMADEYSSSWGVQYIGSQSVHDQSINGTGVKIAVLDTGIDYNHPDLYDNYKGGYNFVSDDTTYLWDENCLTKAKTCHGTHVSGIIAAGHNGFGIVGVAPGSSIYAVKVMDATDGGYASWIISGIEWAVNNSMNIISMSIESTENNSAMLDAVNAAYDAGVLLVAAGGNTYGGAVTYPAAYDAVIAVTAIDQNGQRAGFSPIDPKIELAAPGVDINSTVSDCTLTPPIICTASYKYLSGTSMAAPYVTGVAALIFSTNFPDVNGDGKRDNKDVRQIIDNTTLDIGNPGKDEIYGYGIVDASNATSGHSSYADLSITIDDNVSTVVAGDGNTYAYTITVKNNGPSDASDVKVSDIWPVGFTKAGITPSQGTCDTAVNFTCDLGSISKDGTAIITVGYTVSLNTPPGNYTNRVEVNSTNTDYNTSNNIAEDKNNVFSSADLSITIDDGVSTVVAGDGNTYAYTITVKNNGPSDASDVKVSDIWPVGFTKAGITPSQGTCDTAVNFTCDLGSISKDGTAIITVGYTVPSNTPPDNYTNRAEVSSTTQDYNTNNNVAEKKTIVIIRLTIVRTKAVPIEDAKNVSLLQGNYSIKIQNINLSNLQKIVLDNGTVQLNQSYVYAFNGPEEITENLYVKNKLDVIFIPQGKEKSVGHVTIWKIK